MSDNQLSKLPRTIPLAYSPDETAKMMGLGRTTVYSLLKSKELKSIKIGNRRLITLKAIEEFFSSLQQV